MPDDDALLTRSFELAAAARAAGDHPFGALLAIDARIVAEALNRVNTTADVTAHAETELVRQLERAGQLDLLRQGTVVASCEPCPMCVGAMFWAGARRLVFGLSAVRLIELATAPGADRYGYTVSAHDIGGTAMPPMNILGPFRQDEAAAAHLGFWIA